MADRRAIRVLVVSGGPQFFYDRGIPRGITAELLDKFRQSVNEVLVFNSGASEGIDSLDDLAGQAVYVRKSSSYFEHLTTINEDFAARGLDIIQIQAANELLRTQDIVEMLNAGLDPLMLVAQAYQESGLDHSKVSPVGAVGIMQIRSSTAADKNVGFDDISSLANNVNAGATYLRFLMNRYFADEEMDDLHQWLFGLAAYNAGPARIQRIRRQAASEGLDPNLWIDNVELVAARQIGRETVTYVRNIFKYYVAYRMAWEERRL